MINHAKTIENIKGIETVLKSVKAAQDKANNEIKEWAADTLYSQQHKEAKIYEVKQEFEKYAAGFNDRLWSHAADILEAETELLQSAIDVNDSTFANALAIINGMGNNMPYDQQIKIAQQFRGDYPAEKCLAALYEKNGLRHKVELTNFDSLTHELRSYIAVFVSDVEKQTASYRGIEKTCNKMLESINDDYRVDIGVSHDAFMAAVCAGAGIPVVEN